MAIDAGGWFDWMIKDPGPPARVNGGRNGLKGVVIHSAEGYWPHLRVVLWGDRGSSWHFSNLQDGRCFQHYSIYAQTHCSGAGYPNNNFPAWENEGTKDEPFTVKQNNNNVMIIDEIREVGKWPDTRRPINSGDKAAQLWEHNEMTRFGALPTACPSGRVPWGLYLDRLKEEDVKPYLAWCPEQSAVYFIGPQGARWIIDPLVVKQLEAQFGKMAVTHSAAVINALGVAK